MSTFASKNPYDALGNDPEQDPDRELPPPVEPVDKPTARIGKRNGPTEAPVRDGAVEFPPRGRGGRGRGRGRGDFSGNEQAFRDRDAGRETNRGKPTDDGPREDRPPRASGDRPSRGYGSESRGGRGYRGGRGGGGRGPRDDRHSRGFTTDPNDGAKQAAQSWGEQTGAGEWTDEQAGEAIAKEEQKDPVGLAPEEPTNADGEHPASTEAPVLADEAQPEPEAEPEDKTKSYAAYLAEQAEKKLALGGTLTARQANEGASQKFEGKAISRDEGNDSYMAGVTKARRERERKDKNVFVLEHDIQQREQNAVRGGRGGRGGRGRGEGGFRGPRGGGRGRGEFRGDHRGGRGGSGVSPNVTNEADFPTLGGK